MTAEKPLCAAPYREFGNTLRGSAAIINARLNASVDVRTHHGHIVDLAYAAHIYVDPHIAWTIWARPRAEKRSDRELSGI